MFRNTPQTRALLIKAGYTREPSIETALYKIQASLGKTIEMWNEEMPAYKVDSDDDLREFNSALRDNKLSGEKDGL